VFFKYGTTKSSAFTTKGKPEPVDVIIDVQKTFQAGKTVSLVAPKAGITADQLFQ
jgi:hypothetical protein